MKKFLPVVRLRFVLPVLGLCLLVAVVFSFSEQVSSDNSRTSQVETGNLEKMIVASGNVTLDIDVNRLNGATATARKSAVNFSVVPDSFFEVLVFNDELRGPLPSSMDLVSQSTMALPGRLNASLNQLSIESLGWGGDYDLVVRDAKSGFVFFNVEGHVFNYDRGNMNIEGGRLLISEEYAADLGRPSDKGTVVGDLSVAAAMRTIEISKLDNGEVTSNVLPASKSPEAGTVPGPDVIVGDLSGLAQFGSSSGTQVGLAVGTDSCNAGTIDLNWFANPINDHPVIPQNLYRMSGGSSNTERFEQIGQSSVKHAFTALQNNICGFGCQSSGTGTRLGTGCSDPYGASLNSGPNLGSRAWINPFTGGYPRNDSGTPNNDHSGHSHQGPSHRILTEISDLNTTLNPGATYYAEAQYVTPHEYQWCQANPTQCNMFNNVSYRRYNVSGTSSFSFSSVGSTVRQARAIEAWTGATIVDIKPAPGVDGEGAIAYKVTNPSAGVWHYEYAIYNENLDRAISSFRIPIEARVVISNVAFHAPPQHPGWAADGTVGSAGFSSAPWTQTDLPAAVMWSSQSFAQNPNANAVRWGTLYNIRFDSNYPPALMNAVVGFFKTGAPIIVQVEAPVGFPCPERVPLDGRRCPPAG